MSADGAQHEGSTMSAPGHPTRESLALGGEALSAKAAPMSVKYRRLVVIGAIIAVVGVAAFVSGGAAAILKYKREMLHLSGQHIMLVLYSGGPAIIVGVILGIALTRPSLRRICEPVMQVLSIATA